MNKNMNKEFNQIQGLMKYMIEEYIKEIPISHEEAYNRILIRLNNDESYKKSFIDCVSKGVEKNNYSNVLNKMLKRKLRYGK